MANAGAQHEFPPIPMESWREKAECARTDPSGAPVYDATMWDAPVGKRKKDDKNAVRAAKAKRICNTLCAVRAECAAAFDWRFDEGIRGGHDTPPISSTSKSNVSARDQRVAELLKAGITLDDAVRAVQHKRDREAS